MMYHFTSISHGFYMILQHLRSVPRKKHPMKAMVPLLHRARAPSWPTGSLPVLPKWFQSCALQTGRSCTAKTPPTISNQIWSNTLVNFIELLTTKVTKGSRIIKNTSSCLLVLQKTSRDYRFSAIERSLIIERSIVEISLIGRIGIRGKYDGDKCDRSKCDRDKLGRDKMR